MVARARSTCLAINSCASVAGVPAGGGGSGGGAGKSFASATEVLPLRCAVIMVVIAVSGSSALALTALDGTSVGSAASRGRGSHCVSRDWPTSLTPVSPMCGSPSTSRTSVAGVLPMLVTFNRKWNRWPASTSAMHGRRV